MNALRWSPPGNATDLDTLTDGLEAWDVVMATFFEEAAARVSGVLKAGDTPQIVDAVHDGGAREWNPVPITWEGFPKTLLEEGSVKQALEAAEQLRTTPKGEKYRPQDEYLEWHATYDGEKIVAVDFTCEGPEYWQAIAQGYPDSIVPPANAPKAKGDMSVVTALYQEYVSGEVEEAELLDASGKYDPHNVWNTERGAMHLTHPANALSAEVFLAGDATVLRVKKGVVLIDADALIECAGYGVATRFSDPTIGAGVNGLARSGALISLLNPVGLYISSLDTTGWTKPDGSPVDDGYWTIQRGEKDFILRARYEVPAKDGFTVSDIEIGGETIAYPGQIAQHITMRLTGLSADAGGHQTTPVGCRGEHKATAELVEQPNGRLLSNLS